MIMAENFKLKDRIMEVLRMNDHTFADLAEHVGLTEKELNDQFADNSLEVRTLELISKALRIPLYSLFRVPGQEQPTDEEMYYNVDIWGKNGVELRTTIKKEKGGSISEADIAKLKNELKAKEKLLDELRSKLNK